jgi:hypothetical protein
MEGILELKVPFPTPICVRLVVIACVLRDKPPQMLCCEESALLHVEKSNG